MAHASERSPPREMTVMDDQRDEQPDRQLAFLQELIEEHAIIAGDIIEVAPDTWAIHGSIAVDGEVLLAEYHTPDQARITLGKLPRQTAEPPLSGAPRADEIAAGTFAEDAHVVNRRNVWR
jgi:hypothetical protein